MSAQTQDSVDLAKKSNYNVNNNVITEKDGLDVQLRKEEEEEDKVVSYTYDDDEYVDGIPDLEESILELRTMMTRFFENKFDEAMKACEKWEKYSIYHSHGKSFLRFLYGLLTLEGPEIQSGKEQVKLSMSLLQRKRKQTSIVESLSSFIWKPNYDDYTDEEAHAELCYAESQIMMSLLTFFGDQSLMCLIKGAFRMRSSNQTYKFCQELIAHKNNWDTPIVRMNFESGVSFGIGALNLLLSHLPTKVLKLLAMAGFSGDRELALKELHNAADVLVDSARFKITEIVVVAYNIYMEQLFGCGEADLDWAQRLTDASLRQFPTGAFPLFFSARLQQLRGNPKQAIEFFNKCLGVQGEWKQIHNICYWDLCWSHALLLEWEHAAKYAKIMRDQCQWSPATNMYQFACFTYMLMEQKEKPELKDEILKAMRSVPELKIRYAGKTLPPEKFAITKATAYIAGDDDMVLPAFELFYVWNIFTNAAGSSALLDPIMELIDGKLAHFEQDNDVTRPMDSYYFLLLLKGICLRLLGFNNQAIDLFVEILENEKTIVKDNYIPPHAAFELGLTHLKAGNISDAKVWLEKARTDYSGFLIETMVHLRVHGALNSIKSIENSGGSGSPSSIKKGFKKRFSFPSLSRRSSKSSFVSETD